MVCPVNRSPLAFGLLTGKYSGGVIPEDSRISGNANFVSKVQQERTVGLKAKILQEEKLAKVRPAQTSNSFNRSI